MGQGNRVKLATGKLTGTNNQANPVSAAVQAKCLFANEGNRLFPFEPVKVRLLVDTLHDAVTVPTAAIRQEGNGETFAYVVQPDQTVEKRKLVTGPARRTRASSQAACRPESSWSSKEPISCRTDSRWKSKTRPPKPLRISIGRSPSGCWRIGEPCNSRSFAAESFQYVDALPPTDFHIETINLRDYVSDDSRGSAPSEGRGGPPVSREGFGSRRMRLRPNVAAGGERTGRTFHRVEFTDADLDRLASLAALRSLTFASSAVTDDVLRG